MRLAGIDGCKTGWVAVLAEMNDFASAKLVHFQDVEAFFKAENIDFAIIDMPIGFVDGPTPRNVEKAMRDGLNGKTSSVFSTPCRNALFEFAYGDACWVNEQALGKKLSKQSFALFPKMREIDVVVQTIGQAKLREGHPEVSFAFMNGAPVIASKKTANGQLDRVQLLESRGFDCRSLLQTMPRGKMAADDVLDAAALLWSSRRSVNNENVTLPPSPSRDSVGLEMSVVA